ncbi:MAG: hypothetical protein U0Q14_08580 [Dermatophilaceae bacterium]
MSRHRSRWYAGAMSLALASFALTSVSPANADDPSPAKGKAAGPASAPASKCSLRPSGHASTHNEWLSCLSVTASLDRLPAVGQTAKLTVVVNAADTLTADVSVELPAGMVWVQAPSGMASAAKASKRPEDKGTTAKASAKRAMVAGQRATYTGVVKAIAPGATQIRARATAPYAGGVQAGSDDVLLTVAAAGGSSKAGMPASASTSGTAVATPAGVKLVTTSAGKAAKASVPAATGTRAGSPCDTTVTGSWSYQDQAGVWHPSRNVQVQVWDADTFGDTLLATGVTDWNGGYSICFDSNSEGWPDSGTADVYVKFVTENSIWKVQRGGSPLNWRTGTTNDVTPGSTLNLGSLTTGDPALHRGLHAFDAANDAWSWIPKPRNLCFDQDDTSCRQLVVNWAPDSTDGTYYSLGGNDVHLAADDPNAETTVIHEIGHAIMDDVYNDAFPSAPSCNPHSIQGASSQGCAWTEGFAEWFPATVLNDPFFRWPSGASLDLENAGWNNGWSNGDATEGRIAGALIDLTDSRNEAPWDRTSEGYAPTWNTFMTYVSNNLSQFMTHRALKGYPNSSSVLASLFTNTVDYGFRDPMANYATYVRPQPYVPHNYSFSTNTPYWSVVAVRPTGTNDADLRLYDDYNQSVFLKGSTYGGAETDFVAIDSNRLAYGDFYPRINQYSGTGGYKTVLAQGSATLPVGTSSVAMGVSNVVIVKDVYLTAGVRTTITVTPGVATQDAAVYLMGSTAGVASTYVQSRSAAVASAASYGAGLRETLTYTPTASGWYGFVLVNKAGGGTYTVVNTSAAKVAPPAHR